MENNVLQTLLIVAYLCIALISIVIAVYAIGVSYQGRETQRSKWRKKKRRDELKRKIRELGQKADVEGLREEIKHYDSEIAEIDDKLFYLSVWGTIMLPIICFIVALVIITVIIYVDPTGTFSFPTMGQKLEISTSQFFATMAVFAVVAGVCFQIKTLFAIEWAVSRIPLPEFWTSFPSESKKMRFKPKEQATVEFCVGNKGEDMGENLQVFFNFPPSFIVHGGECLVVKQGTETDYPNFNSAIVKIDFLHIDTTVYSTVLLTMPENEDKYEIPVTIYERKTGKSTDMLLIEIVK